MRPRVAGRRQADVTVGGSRPAPGRIWWGLEDDNQWLCNRGGDALLDSLIFSGGGQSCIRDVWSAGRHVVSGGRHHRRDAIIDNFKRVMQQLETSI